MRLFRRASSALVLLIVACGTDSEAPSHPDAGANGGTPSDGSGGENAQGGSATNAGGKASSGGTSGAGGASNDGGKSSDGGAASSDGGSSTSAGGSAAGGTASSGGTAGAGVPAACAASDAGNVASGTDTFKPNTGKKEVSALTYTNVGATGAYAEVVSGWSKATGCVGDDAQGTLCKTQYKK